jgi:RNA polymerase sigma factor (sigma-70 family)
LTDELVGADETLAGLPARLDLERSLRVLTPGQRQMLEMAYVEEMPAVEIAAALGVTVAQVKSTLHRAKGRVRRNS